VFADHGVLASAGLGTSCEKRTFGVRCDGNHDDAPSERKVPTGIRMKDRRATVR